MGLSSNTRSRTRSSRSRVARLTLGVGVVALFLGACMPKAPSQTTPGTPTQENTDAYQYPENRNGVGDFVYNQLWYFNFLEEGDDTDPANDIAGVAAWGLANPESLMFQKGLTNGFGMIIRDPSEGSSFNIFGPNVDPGVPGNLTASTTFEPGPGPELANPYGTIDVISPDEYHLTGGVTDGGRSLSWDLIYTRGLGTGWKPWVMWPMPSTLGVIPAWVDYHMQMPNAVVNGTYTVDDNGDVDVYTLTDAKGYHDGFNSEFVFSIVEWDWLDYKQDDLSVHLLHPHAPQFKCGNPLAPVDPCLPGNLRVIHEGDEYNFFRGEVEIDYLETTSDPQYGTDYPTKETITAADDEGNTLTLTWTLLRQLPVYYDIPAPFNDTVTYEIIAEFTGSFYAAATDTTVPISGIGWSDWSGPALPQT